MEMTKCEKLEFFLQGAEIKEEKEIKPITKREKLDSFLQDDSEQQSRRKYALFALTIFLRSCSKMELSRKQKITPENWNICFPKISEEFLRVLSAYEKNPRLSGRINHPTAIKLLNLFDFPSTDNNDDNESEI